MTASTPFDVKAFIADTLALASLLDASEEAQWKAGATPVPREDTTERSRGMVSDPTPSIVADGRRLSLRAAVLEAESALEAARRVVRHTGRDLTEALTRHQG